MHRIVDPQLDEVHNLLAQHFYKPERISETATSTRELIAGLGDPFTRLVGPDENRKLEAARKGAFLGIGLTFTLQNSAVVIKDIHPFCWIDRQQVEIGDTLMSVNDEVLPQMHSVSELDRYLHSVIHAATDPAIVIRICKPNGRVVVASVQRKNIPVQTCKAKNVGGFMHLSVSCIAENTARKMQLMFDQTRDRSVILDFRGCPGGSMNGGVQVAELFSTTPITISSRGTDELAPLYCDRNNINRRMVVLVDEKTASAAELIALCMREAGVCIYGSKTMGKSTMQKSYPLDSAQGQHLRITRATWSVADTKPPIIPDQVIPASDSAGTDLPLQYAVQELRKM